MTASTVTGKGIGAANQFMLYLKMLETNSVRIADLTILGDLTVEGDIHGGADSTSLSVDAFRLTDGNEVWDDLRIPVTSLQKKGTNDPNFIQVRDDGSGSTGVFAYEFEDISNANLENELFFVTQLPHTWKEGSSVYPHVHWGPVTTDTGTVRWGLEYSIANVGETFPQTTILYDEAEVTTNSQYKQLIPAGFGEVAMTDRSISALILGRVFRNSSHGNDDLTASAFLFHLDFHFQVNTLGSIEMLSKWGA